MNWLRRIVLKWLFPQVEGARPESVNNVIREMAASIASRRKLGLGDEA